MAFFLAAFTLAGFDMSRHLVNQSVVVGAGAAFGTLIWFALICGLAGTLHQRVGDAFLNRARTGVGGLFIAVALLSAASLLLAG